MEKLIQLVRSTMWVNNPILIDAIYRRLVFYDRLDLITPEFWGLSMGPNIPFEPVLDVTDLQLLVDSELWLDEPQVLWFIFDQAIKLPKEKFRSFGTPKFWDYVLQDPPSKPKTVRIQTPLTRNQPNPPLLSFDTPTLDSKIQVGAGSHKGSPEILDIRDFYQLGEMSRINVRRFATEAAQYHVDFHQLDTVENFHDFIPRVFNDILKRILGDGHHNDMIGIEINHGDLGAGPILVPFRKRKDLNVENILQAFEAVSQSKRGLSIDESFYIRVTIVNDQVGGRPRNTITQIVNWSEWFTKHCGNGGCFIQV